VKKARELAATDYYISSLLGVSREYVKEKYTTMYNGAEQIKTALTLKACNRQKLGWDVPRDKSIRSDIVRWFLQHIQKICYGT
jgi:hypothetical protein